RPGPPVAARGPLAPPGRVPRRALGPLRPGPRRRRDRRRDPPSPRGPGRAAVAAMAGEPRPPLPHRARRRAAPRAAGLVRRRRLRGDGPGQRPPPEARAVTRPELAVPRLAGEVHPAYANPRREVTALVPPSARRVLDVG